jgi:phosphoribosyl 1,2-cyclic phosphodiesterase
MGINVYATKETHQQKNTEKHHRAKFIHVLSTFELGPFKIKAFPIEHDAANPVGFIIYHKECGRTLFLTDSFYVKYRFKKINNFLIEVNYSDEIINENIQKGSTNMFLRNRVLKSHMNLTNAIKLLKANDLKLVKNILLIHLSNTNASTDLFENEIRKATGKPTKVMLDNQTYDISINSF